MTVTVVDVLLLNISRSVHQSLQFKHNIWCVCIFGFMHPILHNGEGMNPEKVTRSMKFAIAVILLFYQIEQNSQSFP